MVYRAKGTFNSTMIVIARRYGQLGNRLFLYAHLIAAARHYGVELRNPSFAEYAKLFPSTRSDLWCRYDDHLPRPNHRSHATKNEPGQRSRDALMHLTHAVAKGMNLVGMRNYPAKIIRLKSGEECDLQGDRFQKAIASGRTLVLQGWMFRSGRLLHEHQPHIQDFFSLDDHDQSAIDRVIFPARSDCDALIGVHIRRGDYAHFQGGRYYYQDSDYARWMRETEEQMPGRRVRFLVCSHEQLDEKQFAGLRVTRGPGTAIQDMYALAETDWMMGPPSTFTAWAAFVSGRARVELGSRDQQVIVPNESISGKTQERASAA